MIESGLAVALSSVETVHGDPLAALDYVAVAIRNYHDSGGAIQMALTILSAVFDRLRRYEPAATIAGFAISPLTIAVLRTQHRDHPPPRCPRRRDL
jgi:hypothetical protein